MSQKMSQIENVPNYVPIEKIEEISKMSETKNQKSTIPNLQSTIPKDWRWVRLWGVQSIKNRDGSILLKVARFVARFSYWLENSPNGSFFGSIEMPNSPIAS